MNHKEKILELLGVMQSEMKEIHSKIDSMEDRLDSMEGRLGAVEQKLDDLIESHDETRTSVNALLAWSERVSSIRELN